MSEPMTDEQLAGIKGLADRVADDPFFVSDCEGSLQVWRETALTHVRRDEAGAIEMYSFPFTYRVTDEVVAPIDLDTWDPGESATDDKRRQDINDLVDARAAVPALVAEIRHLRAVLDAEKAAHRFSLRQRNNRSNRITHLRDLANAASSGDTAAVQALIDAVRDTLAASVDDHKQCGGESS